MTKTIPRRISPLEIKRLSSPYISYGLAEERWSIDAAEVNDQHINAVISMTSCYRSDTDEDGFHLSFFTASQIVSQLIIIYMHLWAGLSEKSREVWMVEFHSRHVRPVRNHKTIRASIHVEKIRRRHDTAYLSACCQIEDDNGGLFEITCKGMMS